MIWNKTAELGNCNLGKKRGWAFFAANTVRWL